MEGRSQKAYRGGKKMRVQAIVVCLLIAILIAVAPSNGTLLIEQEWERYPGNPILSPGPPGSWDDEGIGHSCVIKDENIYKMWYAGVDYGSHVQIGYATSLDGIVWSKYGFNPILTSGLPGSWEEVRVENPVVIKDEGIYKMWYDGRNIGNKDQIGYAESTDGINWVKSPDNPVIIPGSSGSWDSFGVSAPSVIKDGNLYKMWYDGHANGPHRIGYAFSPDGIIWTKHPSNPILDIVPFSWENDAVFTPTVIKDGGLYKMWYAGRGFGFLDRIGYAESLDGITWTKFSSNPVLIWGELGAWDHGCVAHPSVIHIEGQYKMWYTGYDGTVWRIGLAEWTVGPIPATIDIDPDTLNLKSKGKWITCYIELSEGYDVADIDASTILLNDSLSPILDPKYGFVKSEDSYIMDHDGDGILERMVKFDRSDVEDMLLPGTYNLKVTGELKDGTTFEGYSDEIRVIEPP